MSGPVQAPHAPRRSRARTVAFVVWLIVFLVVAIPTVWLLVSYVSQPADQRVPAAGGDVTISEPGEYAVYAESTRGSPGNWGGIASVTAPSGAPATVTGSGIEENYNYDSRVATRIGTLTATETGTYRIVGDDRGTVPGDELVVSSRTVGAIFGVVAGSIATGFVLFAGMVLALVMFLVGRSRRPAFPAAAAAPWPGQHGGPAPSAPPPGAGQPYGSAPYGSAPYGSAPYGSAGPPPAGTAPAGIAPGPGAEPSSGEPTVTVQRPDGTDDRR